MYIELFVNCRDKVSLWAASPSHFWGPRASATLNCFGACLFLQKGQEKARLKFNLTHLIKLPFAQEDLIKPRTRPNK